MAFCSKIIVLFIYFIFISNSVENVIKLIGICELYIKYIINSKLSDRLAST